ncbi:MAG: hypothetical protein A2340_16425 [Lentisphaerae bacterium RIFOXYB12_FULL_60_10]|nr:MAG: hypothetical protein A2340_16425 [Lentisphaerae bacterium RIFOXYB12_FULL_60_10]
MAPRVILLDSNAYFRLARTIHPLLSGTFGEPPPYALRVLKVLDEEYLSSVRLRSKFEWVNRPEYRADRAANCYIAMGKPATQVEAAFSYLEQHARENGFDLAPEDIRALAVGLARGFPVVTDDKGMVRVAKAFDVEPWSVVKLLKVMVTERRIEAAKVDELLQYLDHENDLPMSKPELKNLYVEYFGRSCPL